MNGYAGSTGLGNVVEDNDTLNSLATDLTEVTLSVGGVEVTTPVSFLDGSSNPTTQVVLNVDGTVDVLAGTPAGTYTLEYTICEILNPTNCDTATITVEVDPPAIDAVDDSATGINGNTGANDVVSAFECSDTLNGVAVNPAEVTLSVGGVEVTTPVSFLDGSSNPTTQVVLNADGTVDVLAGTPAGTYTLEYTICEILNPTNCDTATITVTVIAATIDAIDDSATGINGYTGADDVVSAFDLDTLNGLTVDPAEVTLSVGGVEVTTPVSFLDGSNNPTTQVVLNADGSVDVLAGTVLRARIRWTTRSARY